jgi:hypothetical protein
VTDVLVGATSLDIPLRIEIYSQLTWSDSLYGMFERKYQVGVHKP